MKTYLICPIPFMSNALSKMRFLLPSGLYPYFWGVAAVPWRTSKGVLAAGESADDMVSYWSRSDPLMLCKLFSVAKWRKWNQDTSTMLK